jgi:hypothetical protein
MRLEKRPADELLCWATCPLTHPAACPHSWNPGTGAKLRVIVAQQDVAAAALAISAARLRRRTRAPRRGAGEGVKRATGAAHALARVRAL